MKTGEKKKQAVTPETVAGACMTGRFMTKQEEVEMGEWVAADRAKYNAKQPKITPPVEAEKDVI